jgi:protein gp37
VLREVPAAVRFLSVEPLLGSLGKLELAGIHWVIVGGESGRSARPMHPDWVRAVRDQCLGAGVPFLFKQWGAWVPHKPVAGGSLGSDVRADRVRIVHPSGQSDVEVFQATGHNTIPGSRYMARIGKHAAGRVLDGRTWDEYPTQAA